MGAILRRTVLAANLLVCALAGLTAILAASSVRAQDLVADLSDHRISIGSSFAGAQVIVFGAISSSSELAAEPGIVVIVRGDEGPVTVRRKERIAGVWINRRAVTFETVPRTYHVLSNRPLEDIASERQLGRLQIGLDQLRLEAAPSQADEEMEETFRAALIDRRKATGLFVQDTAGVLIRGQNLFRASVSMPSSVPEGSYRVQVYLFRDGQVIGAQSFRLPVEKVGFENIVNRFSRDYSLAYGIVAVIVAVVTGWGASSLFRRV